nr:MAG TPA_asm: hypothetical protein [Caudoviricetes sp.]DAZ17784.1 MAG TPA: hypothetical protein [Caudoviricetes sp.]
MLPHVNELCFLFNLFLCRNKLCHYSIKISNYCCQAATAMVY